jgi:hypothetical protein
MLTELMRIKLCEVNHLLSLEQPFPMRGIKARFGT